MPNHPSVDQLREFGLGLLDDDSMDSVSAHVAVCDTCCQKLAQVHDDTLVELCKEAGGDTEVGNPSAMSDEAVLQARRALEAAFEDHPRYKLRSPLGHGGMGLVYKAEHRLMDRLVAIKVIHPALTANPKAIDRFQREIKAAGKLNHNNIVAALDAEQTGPFHYLVMEFAPGVSLDRIVKHRGVFSVAAACRTIQQAAQGLSHAHERHMVHRDIKPHNLLATLDGRVKILDFGLARFASEHRGDGSLTGDGMLGTPEYMSPEQIQQSNEADIRADIYGLGCTLYYLLAGHSPFGDGSRSPSEVLLAHLSQPIPPLSKIRNDVTPRLERILAKMLAKDPAHRYASPSEVVAAMDEVIRGGAERPSPDLSVAAVGGAGDDPDGEDEGPIELMASPVAQLASDAAPNLQALQTELPTLDAAVSDPIQALGTQMENVSQRRLPPHRPSRNNATWMMAAGVGAVAILVIALLFVINRPLQQPSSTDSPDGAGTPALVTSKLNARFLVFVPNEYWEVDLTKVEEGLRGRVDYDLVSVNGNVRGFNNRVEKTIAKRVMDTATSSYDGVILLGGYTELNAGDPDVQEMLRQFNNSKKLIAGICTGQKILHRAGLLDGRKIARINRKHNLQLVDSAALEQSKTLVFDGHLLTCTDDDTADELAEAVVQWAAERQSNP